MRNLIENCQAKIKAHRLPALDFNSDFVFPFLDGYSVVNLPASIAHWLGVPLEDSQPLDSEISGGTPQVYDEVILLVIDSLGMPLFNRLMSHIREDLTHSIWYPLRDQITLACLTSTTPSTTATALTSLWTGKEACRHGMLGYEMWLAEFGVIANMISQTPVDQADELGGLHKLDLAAKKFLPVECLGSRFSRLGIQTNAYLHASIADSELSQLLMTDAKIHAWRTYTELWQKLLQQLQNPASKTYTHIYLGDIDSLSHQRGPGHELVWQAWLDFSCQLAQFLIAIREIKQKNILVVLTADHGQIDQEIRADFELANHPELLGMLKRMPSGEARLPYLYPREGFADKITACIRKTWPDKFYILRREEFISSGVLGSTEPSQEIQERIGELVVIPTGKDYLRWTPKANRLLGRHGGFLEDEMLVPLMIICK